MNIVNSATQSFQTATQSFRKLDFLRVPAVRNRIKWTVVFMVAFHFYKDIFDMIKYVLEQSKNEKDSKWCTNGIPLLFFIGIIGVAFWLACYSKRKQRNTI